MPDWEPADERPGSRQVVLILRLMLDGQGQLRYGELLDASASAQGRFGNELGLVAVMQCWLERQRHGHEFPLDQMP
jgi:hypothetical protein